MSTTTVTTESLVAMAATSSSDAKAEEEPRLLIPTAARLAVRSEAVQSEFSEEDLELMPTLPPWSVPPLLPLLLPPSVPDAEPLLLSQSLLVLPLRSHCLLPSSSSFPFSQGGCPEVCMDECAAAQTVGVAATTWMVCLQSGQRAAGWWWAAANSRSCMLTK